MRYATCCPFQMVNEWKTRSTILHDGKMAVIRLRDRYEIIGFDQIAGEHKVDRPVHHQLKVHDLRSTKISVIPITQIGQPFPERVLQAKDIRRAYEAPCFH